jgi:2,3-diaminopropionate biosynthesis protein SbnB
MLVLGYADVDTILDGREIDVVDAVENAYTLHDRGRSVVPHSTFLRFPDQPRDRIIGLPAYVGGDEPVAGIKWIASFPGNLTTGLPRANAVVVLNSMTTGQPYALLEGSIISAKRTAASAASAARLLTRDTPPDGVSLLGCGVINLEVLRFLVALLPSLRSVSVYDTDPARAERFTARVAEVAPLLEVAVVRTPDEALGAHGLVSIATTAAEPHLGLDAARPGAVVLHLSLRDLYPDAILAAQNVVDDADHVCREGTSLYLAEQRSGDRSFIDAPIGALLDGAPFDRDPARVLVYSPFGLGALDMAVAHRVVDAARTAGLGTHVENFLPEAVAPAPAPQPVPQPAPQPDAPAEHVAAPAAHSIPGEGAPMTEPTAAQIFHVVLNDEEQYSIWRTDRPVPAGWHTAGFSGPREECLAHIATVWTDIRPAGLRRRTEAAVTYSASAPVTAATPSAG